MTTELKVSKTFACTETEFKRIKANAKKEGFKNHSQFIIEKLATKKQIKKSNV